MKFWGRKKYYTWYCDKGHKVTPYQVYDEKWKMHRWVKSEECFECSLNDLLKEAYSGVLEKNLTEKNRFFDLMKGKKCRA